MWACPEYVVDLGLSGVCGRCGVYPEYAIDEGKLSVFQLQLQYAISHRDLYIFHQAVVIDILLL